MINNRIGTTFARDIINKYLLNILRIRSYIRLRYTLLVP
jgi:hypothetical protein